MLLVKSYLIISLTYNCIFNSIFENWLEIPVLSVLIISKSKMYRHFVIGAF